MISVLEELAQKGSFLCLQKDNKRYYLLAIDDLHLKYSDNWQTEMINSDTLQEGKQNDAQNDFYKMLQAFDGQLNPYVDDEPSIRTFDMSFLREKREIDQISKAINNLSRKKGYQQEQYQNNSEFDESEIEENLLNSEEDITGQDQPIGRIKQMNKITQQPMDQTTANTNQQKETVETRRLSYLEQIIQNYEELIMNYQCEESDQVIQFKNPLSLDLNKLKNCQLDLFTLHIAYEKVRFDSPIAIRLDQIKQAMQENNMTLEIKSLKIVFDIFITCRCEKSWNCHNNCWDYFDEIDEEEPHFDVRIPNINTQYIYVDFTYKEYYTMDQVRIDICQTPFDNKKRRIMIKKAFDKISYTFNQHSQNQGIEIPSIMNGYRCFIPISTLSQQLPKIEELLLEDQTLLTMISVFKQQIDQILLNNASFIFADLFLD